jgi:hypothetical protein
MKLKVVAFAVMAGLAGQAASAAPSPDAVDGQAAVAQCVVMRTTGADRALTAQWIFAAMSRSPHIADLSAVSDSRKAELDKAFGQLLTRIVMKECLEQVRPLAIVDLTNAFEVVGKALGEVAMQELLGNPSVDKAIGAYTEYLSEDDFKPLIESIDKAQSK